MRMFEVCNNATKWEKVTIDLLKELDDCIYNNVGFEDEKSIDHWIKVKNYLFQAYRELVQIDQSWKDK